MKDKRKSLEQGICKMVEEDQVREYLSTPVIHRFIEPDEKQPQVQMQMSPRGQS